MMLTEKVDAAITDQMISELKRRMQVGDIVQVLRWDGWQGQKRSREEMARKEWCPVVSMSENLFVVQLKEGFRESFTYVDLFRQYNIKFLVMTDKKREEYKDLVLKRADLSMCSGNKRKRMYQKKIDAIDKKLDVYVNIMDQTRRLCG